MQGCPYQFDAIANRDALQNAIFDQDVKANGTEAPANETEKIEYETVTKTRKKTIRAPLKISGPGFTLPKLTPEQLKVMNCTVRDTSHGHYREGSPLFAGGTPCAAHKYLLYFHTPCTSKNLEASVPIHLPLWVGVPS